MVTRSTFGDKTVGLPKRARSMELRMLRVLEQTLPPSLWRDSRLRFLNSFMKKLDQLMEETQLPADYHATRYRPRFEHITGPYEPQQ